jgi:hypothetical protein
MSRYIQYRTSLTTLGVLIVRTVPSSGHDRKVRLLKWTLFLFIILAGLLELRKAKADAMFTDTSTIFEAISLDDGASVSGVIPLAFWLATAGLPSSVSVQLSVDSSVIGAIGANGPGNLFIQTTTTTFDLLRNFNLTAVPFNVRITRSCTGDCVGVFPLGPLSFPAIPKTFGPTAAPGFGGNIPFTITSTQQKFNGEATGVESSNITATETFVGPRFDPLLQKLAGELASALDVLGTTLSWLSLPLDLAVEFDPRAVVLDSFGIWAGSPAAKTAFADDILNNTNLAVSTIGVSLGCFIVAPVLSVPCAIAMLGLDVAVFQSIATAVRDGDPPDPAYNQAFVPVIEASPIPLSAQCQDLGSAAESAPFAIDQANEWLNAVNVTNNRYQTAISAGDFVSATLQYTNLQNYIANFNNAAQVASQKLTCFSSLLSASGIGNELPSSQDEISGVAFAESNRVTALPVLEDILRPFGFTEGEINRLTDLAIADFPLVPTATAVESLNAVAADLGTTTGAVPEPSSILLLGSGIIVLVLCMVQLDKRRFPKALQRHGSSCS